MACTDIQKRINSTTTTTTTRPIFQTHFYTNTTTGSSQINENEGTVASVRQEMGEGEAAAGLPPSSPSVDPTQPLT
jgi:hypothetical protein